MHSLRQHGWWLVAKRAFDFSAAVIGLTVLAPLFAVVSLLILATMGRPILFRQQRPGKNAKLFVFLKFRSMSEQVDRLGNPLADGERITWIGRLLRATSLDELPQLWNVLC